MQLVRDSALRIAQRGDRLFRWRGGDVSRLEGLFDAVIALCLTMVIISTSVPQSFDKLLNSLRAIPGFVACGALLIMCWYYHFIYHRRYGLEDMPTVVMNSIILCLIVVFVYPMKFVYYSLLSGNAQVRSDQVTQLMGIFSGLFCAIFLMFLLLHVYAYWKREPLELNEAELVLTKSSIAAHGLHVMVGLLSLCFIIFRWPAPLCGLVYFIIAPAQGVNGWWWGRFIED